MVKEKTDDDLVLFSVAPQRNRASLQSKDFPPWLDDSVLDRGLKDLVFDSDGDDLKYSVDCLNCPGGRKDLFQIVKNSVTNKHQIKVNNANDLSGVLGYQASPISITITVADDEFQDEMSMQIFIEDVNESPVFPTGKSKHFFFYFKSNYLDLDTD